MKSCNKTFIFAFICFVAYASVATSIPLAQNTDGGFGFLSRFSTLHGTETTMFLINVCGAQGEVNVNEVASFVRSLRTTEGGYSQAAGLPADIVSTKEAVRTFMYLGLEIPDVPSLLEFVQSLYSSDVGLFATQRGEAPSVKATADAVEIFELLNQLENSFMTEVLKSIRAVVETAFSSSSYTFQFQDPSLVEISQKYYGVYLGIKSGFSFHPPSAFLRSLFELYDKETGVFYTTAEKKSATPESIFMGISAASMLNSIAQKDNSDLVLQELLGAIHTYTDDAETEYYLLRAIVAAGGLNEVYKSAFAFNLGSNLNKIMGVADFVLGDKLSPAVAVEPVGFTDPQFTVDLTITYPTGKKEEISLEYDQDKKFYHTQDELDTNAVGEVLFSFKAKKSVNGLGSVSFSVEEKRRIGYDVKVTSSASLGSRKFALGDPVLPGTHFYFAVELEDANGRPVSSFADSSITFSVLDSSSVTVHSEERILDSSTQSFEHTLADAGLPEGPLSVVIEVSQSGVGVHSSHTSEYAFGLRTVASKIAFDGADEPGTYKLGDSVRISIEPAALQDGELKAFHSTINGNDVASKRKLYADLVNSAGQTILSVPGTPSTQKNEYSFDVSIPVTLEFVVSPHIVFRYETASGKFISLLNFDTLSGDVFEEGAELRLIINSELHIDDVKSLPNTKEYKYGEEVNFDFRVRDSVSSQYLKKGDALVANVYLSMLHSQEGSRKPIVSARAPFIQEEGNEARFTVRWSVTPNVLSGEGTLLLNVQGAEGKIATLYKEGSSTEAVSIPISVGGIITMKERVHTTTFKRSTKTILSASFTLSCEEVPLKGAVLRSNLVYKGGNEEQVIAENIPVAQNEEGLYSVAFNVDHEKAKSGEYSFNFYREVDRSDEDTEAETTFLSVDLYHSQLKDTKFPLKMHFIAFMLLAVAFAYLVRVKRSTY